VEFESGCRISILSKSAFDNSSLESICIPSSVETIGESCFRCCRYLANVTFEPKAKLADIGKSAFTGCSSLRSICLPAQIKTIAKSCFKDCQVLSDVTFESGCKIASLGDLVFENSSSLRSICIPSSIETISKSCFKNCPNFECIFLEDGYKLSVESLQELQWAVFAESNGRTKLRICGLGDGRSD
jgi:hypothetical protein